MQIEVKGRNTPVTDELREHVERRFTKVGKQVSEFARLEIEVYEERNPAIADNQVAEATLALKGVTLRAQDRARDLRHAINLCRGGALAPGQAPSREAPRTAQGRDGDHSHRDGARGVRRRDGHSQVAGTTSRRRPASEGVHSDGIPRALSGRRAGPVGGSRSSDSAGSV